MAYIYDLTDTWSAGGTVFNAIKMNVTDSASAVASKLVSLQTNGTEHFSVTKAGAGYFSGNVGIGVASLANTRIYVRTAAITDTAYYADNGSNSGFKVKFASSLTSILNDFGADLVLGTNDTERMRISAAGLVGIGTASPSEKLSVAGNIAVGFDSASANTVLKSFTTGHAVANRGATIAFGMYDSTFAGMKLWDEAAANASFNRQYITFDTHEGAFSSGERMRIDSYGNVGIGTASPTNCRVQIKGANNSTAAYADGLKVTSLNETIETQYSWAGINSNDNVKIATNNTERMRIDSNGLVGIGTSVPISRLNVSFSPPGSIPALGSGVGGVAIGPAASYGMLLGTISDGTGYIQQQRFDAGTAVYPLALQPNGGNVGIGTASPSGKFNISAPGLGQISYFFGGTSVNYTDVDTNIFRSAAGTERMRIDSAGRVLIGTTTGVGTDFTSIRFNSAGSYPQGLNMVDSNASASGTYYQVFRKSDDTSIGLIRRSGTDNAIFIGGTSYLALGSADTERMRIDTNGNLLWGKTSTGSEVTTDGAILYKNASGGGSTAYFTNGGNGTVMAVSTQGDTNAVIFFRSGSNVGSIGVTSSATSYNTSSDYRLKDIDGPIANSGAYIDALKPVQGSWKADGSRFIGLLAHEVQEVSETPIATGEKDGEKMQAMDYSAPELIANLIAELQSLRARVAQLEGN